MVNLIGTTYMSLYGALHSGGDAKNVELYVENF